MNTLKRILKGILKFCGICLLIFLAMCAYSIISALTTSRTGRKVETPGLSLSYGEIESLTVGGACDGQIVVKVQAFPVSNSESRAFESVQDLVLNHGFDACKAIDYWAVNPASGNKFLSFSLDSALISKIASGSIGAEEMAGEVSGLWVDSSVVQ